MQDPSVTKRINELSERIDSIHAVLNRHNRELLDCIATCDDMRDKVLRKIQSKKEKEEEPVIRSPSPDGLDALRM